MGQGVASGDKDQASKGAGFWVRIVVGIPITVGIFWAFFWLGGGVGWVQGWIFFGVLMVGQTVAGVVIKRRDPELLRRRAVYGEGTKSWDKVILAFFGLTYVAVLLVAALDASHGWAPLPWWLIPVGMVLYVVGMGIATWAMTVNTHFEKTVRIQTDRNHTVCQDGPYQVVRHPGYVGASLGFPLATPLLLGSAWALVPALLCVATLVLRTALEDRTLRAELDGYEAFTRRTRARLVPGIW